MTNDQNSVIALPTSAGVEERLAAGRNMPHDERLLHKIIKEVHRLNIKERELALVILQAIGAWNGIQVAE